MRSMAGVLGLRLLRCVPNRGRGRGKQCGSILEPRRLQIFQQAFPAALAAESALAVAAETAGSVEQVRAVHPDDPSFQLRGNMQCHVDVLAPNAGRQAIDGVVGQLNRFSRSAKRHRSQHGSEDLLLRNDGCGMHIAQQRGRIVKAARRQSDLRLPASCALRDSLANHALNTIELHARDDRTDVDCLIQRKADAQRAHALADLADQSLGDAFLHQQARARAAHLALD